MKRFSPFLLVMLVLGVALAANSSSSLAASLPASTRTPTTIRPQVLLPFHVYLPFVMAACGGGAQVKLQVLLPFYVDPINDPNNFWDDLVTISSQYASTVSTTIIINPSPDGDISGPPDSSYQQAIAGLRAANPSIKIIGYVHTDYGDRLIDQVRDNIDAYHSGWQVDGFFIDLVDDATAYQLDYYTNLYQHIKSLNANYEVILNPGTQIDEQYISNPVGSTAVIYENPYDKPGNTWLDYQPDDYVSNYPADRFGMLVYNVSASNMQSSLALAQARNISYVWVTDDILDNPWDSLPSYLQDEFKAISKLNCP